MKNRTEMIRELERGVYFTAQTVKLRCAKNRDLKKWISVSEIVAKIFDTRDERVSISSNITWKPQS